MEGSKKKAVQRAAVIWICVVPAGPRAHARTEILAQ
jgi:hypothetical protein